MSFGLNSWNSQKTHSQHRISMTISNGFGSCKFGTTPAGMWNPDPATLRKRATVQARYLNPDTGNPVLVTSTEDDGSQVFSPMHPVDQQVLLALRTTKSSIYGMQNFGSGIRSIEFKDDQFEAKVKAKAEEALAFLIAKSKITLNGILFHPQHIEFLYTNLASRLEQSTRVQG